jgi:transcriptional regulator with XRE-family HTH domain
MDDLNFWGAYELYCSCAGIETSSQSTADLWGVSRSAISAWKKNKTIPRGDILAKMSCYFNAPIECLLGLPEKKDHQNTVLALFNALDSENQKAVLLYMEFVLSKQKSPHNGGQVMV